MASSSAAGPKMNQKDAQKCIDGMNTLRTELREFVQKRAQLETEIYEHSSVLNTLEKVPKDRKCFRMLGGVLMEQKVSDVSPDLKHEMDKFKELLEELTKRIDSKEKELTDYIKTNKLVFVDQKNMAEGK